MRLHATTSMRMLSRRDPWVNILRGTVAGLGAAVAGVDSMTVLPFTSAIGLPDSAARRIARNTQLVLQQESSLSRVVDPAGGSWAIENLTDEMAQKAWSLFQEIEREGGMLASLETGALQQRIATVAEVRARRVADLSDPLTGTSAFPNLTEQPVAVERVDLDALRAEAAARVKAAQSAAAAPAVATLAEAHTALTDGVRDGAPLSALIGALAHGDGARVPPLVRGRLGEPFERFRDASQAHAEANGQPPVAFLAAIGALARYTPAAAYVRNFLAAGGIDAVAGGGGTEIAEITKEFQASGAEVAVICSDKAGLAEYGAEVAKALAAAGAREVFVAGQAVDGEPAIDAVDGYMYDGCDVEAVLQGILERMGILQQ
jgi:methylmalonyl-CoA mutase